MTNAVDEALRKAAEAQANAAKAITVPEQPAQAQTSYVAVQSAAAGKVMTLDDLPESADHYITPKDIGMFELKSHPGELLESFIAEIDLSTTQIGTCIRAGNTNTKYFKTLDGGITEASSGTSWAQAVAEAERIQPGVKGYTTVGIYLTVLEEAKSMKGKVVLSPGEVVARWTSYTELAPFKAFTKSITAAGADYNTARAKVKVTCVPKTGNGNKWGVTNLELIELL